MIDILTGSDISASIIIESWQNKRTIMNVRSLNLTDADYYFEDGKETKIIDKFQLKTGLSKLSGQYSSGYNLSNEIRD